MTEQRVWSWWAPHSAALPGLGPEPGPLSPAAPSAVTVPTATGCPGCRASVSLRQRAGWRAPQSLRPSPHCRGPRGVPDPRPACSRLRCGLGEERTCFGSPRLSRPQCRFPCAGQGRCSCRGAQGGPQPPPCPCCTMAEVRAGRSGRARRRMTKASICHCHTLSSTGCLPCPVSFPEHRAGSGGHRASPAPRCSCRGGSGCPQPLIPQLLPVPWAATAAGWAPPGSI